MARTVLVFGVPFDPLFHRDGRMVRAGGLFAFTRRDGARHVILHMELAEAINLRAVPSHPRWAWALGEGFNELLVCLASTSVRGAERTAAEVAWHADAEFWVEGARISDEAVQGSPSGLVEAFSERFA